jgi:hypothetical protein
MALIQGSSSKKVRLLACGREEDQQEDEEEPSRRSKDTEKEAFRRDARHAAVRGQNRRDRTSVVFAILGAHPHIDIGGKMQNAILWDTIPREFLPQ